MESSPLCPQCEQTNTSTDNILWICPDCSHEWNDNDLASDADERTVRDANGTVLNDGDTVTLIKDLKVRGTSCSRSVRK